MFRVSKEQLDAFRENAVAEPRRKIVAEIERVLPDESARYGHERLISLVDRAIDKADAYGMGSERGTCIYSEAMLLFGEDFDTNSSTAWSRDVLTNPTLDGRIKSRLIALRIRMETGKRV